MVNLNEKDRSTKEDSGPVGRSETRVDAVDKVTGKAVYADDFRPQGLLYASVVRSPISSGKIETIDTSQVMEIEGVESVVTAEDVPGSNVVPIIENDMPALASEKVRYIGEPVALVAAREREIAERAVETVEVEYEENDAVFDPLEALEEGSPQVAQDEVNEGGNLFDELILEKGDADRALEEAPVVEENEYRTGHQEHGYIEPQGMTAIPGARGKMEIHGTLQCPFYVQNAVSAALGYSINKVRVVQLETGGAFGGKEDVPSQVGVLAALLAHNSGKPVKLTYDRREDIEATSKRHPSVVRYRTGADEEGNLLGVEAEVFIDSGAYQTLSEAVLFRSLVHTAGPYSIPNVKVVARSVATNKVPNGAFRGFGSPQVIFPHESQMDLLAERVDKRPDEVREKNVLRSGDRTSTNQKVDKSVGLGRTLTKAKELSGWTDTRSGYEDWNETHERVKKGIGLSTVMYGVGMGAAAPFLEKAGVYLKLEVDGTLTIAVGNTEMGQGAETVLTQIAAEPFGLGLDRVDLTEIDTSRVPDSGPTVASRTTTMTGNAIIDATETLKKRISSVARELLECSEVYFEKGYVVDRSDSSNRAELNEVAGEMWTENVDLAAEGWAKKGVDNWEPETGQGDAYFVYSYATHVSEVKIDSLTGRTRVTKHVAVHDSGKIINPSTAAGQVEGGVAQGIGYALTEDLEEEEGKFPDPDLTNYLMPTSQDVPDDLVVDFVEADYPEGPYGAKGLGEVPLMASHAAVINAVSHAIGNRIFRYPAVPERILEAYSENS
ncbi:xanthine dehydrogenase family protein molybdopterin-binding subunit [Candidatus Bipolaricaulota bacterium]|nr:xanthine dehydrogenase family protein molybdopterin-binding subunit [Candidatus Bipolaricaulota bacterium]